MSELDSSAIYERLDPYGLYARIAGLPAQIEEAWEAARALELPEPYRQAREIVVLGMGGSGVGGGLLQALAAAGGARTPVYVVRGYRPPAFVGESSLVLASSNSGNTEETLSAFDAALAAGAMCVAISTGGQLIETARHRGVPALTFSWDGEPRSALGWSSASLMAIASGLGLIPELDGQLAPALASMRALQSQIARDVPEGANTAKQLAGRLRGRLPVYVGAEIMAPVAYRWRTQTNENAKSWAIADELPEMNHTAHAGYGLPAAVVSLLRAVFLRHAAMHPRIILRVDATCDVMRAAGIEAEVLDVPGEGLLAQMLYAIHLGDFTTYYLGLLNGVEPSPITALEDLKKRLGAIPA